MTKYLLKCKYVTLQGNRDDIQEFQDEAEVQEFLKKYGSDYQEITVYKVVSTNLLERVKRRCDECEAFCLKPYRYPNCEIGELEKKREG